MSEIKYNHLEVIGVRKAQAYIPPERFGLIQEELAHDPWKMLVACICLNLTSIKQVRPVLDEFFKRWPSAEALVAGSDVERQKEVQEIIRPLGLYNRRMKALFNMSDDYLNHTLQVNEFYGIGKYALDSYKIFVQNLSLSVDDVQDKELKKYLAWKATR